MAAPTTTVTPGSGQTINTLANASSLQANSPTVGLATDQIFPVTLVTGAPTSTLTRPANTTAYAAGQLVASSVTAGSVAVPSVTIPANTPIISSLRLRTNVTTGWSGAVIMVSLWTAAPTYTNGDGGTYAVATGSASFLGQFSISLNQYADGAVGRAGIAAGSALVLTSAQTTIYWDMDILSAATPISSQTFTLTAECHG